MNWNFYFYSNIELELFAYI